MHANVTTDKGGGGGGSWRLPPDETLQIGDKQKEEVAPRRSISTTQRFFNEIFQRLQDIGYPSEGHNWRSIIFSLLVINFVIAGIVTAIYLLG